MQIKIPRRYRRFWRILWSGILHGRCRERQTSIECHPDRSHRGCPPEQQESDKKVKRRKLESQLMLKVAILLNYVRVVGAYISVIYLQGSGRPHAHKIQIVSTPTERLTYKHMNTFSVEISRPRGNR